MEFKLNALKESNRGLVVRRGDFSTGRVMGSELRKVPDGIITFNKILCAANHTDFVFILRDYGSAYSESINLSMLRWRRLTMLRARLYSTTVLAHSVWSSLLWSKSITKYRFLLLLTSLNVWLYFDRLSREDNSVGKTKRDLHCVFSTTWIVQWFLKERYSCSGNGTSV